MDAKAVVDSAGVGCEPASAASVAGAKKLLESGIIDKKDKVVCIITGNILKDPDSTINYHLSKLSGIVPKFPNKPTVIEATVDAVKAEVK
jgi:threonine synthase